MFTNAPLFPAGIRSPGLSYRIPGTVISPIEVIDLKRDRKSLLLCLAVPLAVGGASALLTRDEMQHFASLRQPPLSPPGWLFPVVWTLLFLMMGLASWLMQNSGAGRGEIRRARTVYAVQLVFNFFWTILFFNLGRYLFAFVWLLVLWCLILLTFILFSRLDKRAGYLLIPYLLWVTFAGYLNFGIWMLNG